MNTGTPKQSLDQLQAWAREIESEMAEIRGAMTPLEQRLAAAKERHDLIQRLIRLTEESPGQQQASTQRGSQPASASGPQDVEGHIELVLREAGAPMHISDLRRALVDRAVPLPGRGDEANIIVRLRRAPERFTRTGRGTYALTSLGLKEVPPAKRRRRARR
jgi:hypothetical protein